VLVKPRLLVVSPRFLFPLDQGGRIRTANTLRHNKGGAFDITLVSPAPADAHRYAGQTEALCDRFLSWPEAPVSRLRRTMALASALPVTVATDASAAGRALVAAELAKQPDAVLVDFPHAAVLLPEQLAVPSIMFTHNVEAEIFSRHAEVARGPMRRVWRDQARKMLEFEARTLDRFDTVIAVSTRDADALRKAYGLCRVEAVETGVDVDFYAFSPPGNTSTCGPANGTVVFTGLVDDVRPYVAQAQVYAIPLRVGSGTRIKVFEAMAMGCPVVSTRLGVEGLPVMDGTDYVAADTAPDFAAALLAVLGNPQRQLALAMTARALVLQHFSWAQVTRRFEEICLSAMCPGPVHRGFAGTGFEPVTFRL